MWTQNLKNVFSVGQPPRCIAGNPLAFIRPQKFTTSAFIILKCSCKMLKSYFYFKKRRFGNYLYESLVVPYLIFLGRNGLLYTLYALFVETKMNTSLSKIKLFRSNRSLSPDFFPCHFQHVFFNHISWSKLTKVFSG